MTAPIVTGWGVLARSGEEATELMRQLEENGAVTGP